MGNDVKVPTTADFQYVLALEQRAITGGMKINPYMAFGIPSKPVTLTPAVDRWTVSQTEWLSDITQKFLIDSRILDSWHRKNMGTDLAGYPSYTNSSTSTAVVGTSSQTIQDLRQIDVVFEAVGFGPGETLTSIKFDGIPVTPVAV